MAQTEQYTPGPWDVSGAVGSDRFWIGAKYPCINGLPARFVIANALIPDSAEIGYTGGALNPDVAEANARLIAAAPELLEALEWAVNDMLGVTKYTNPEQWNNCMALAEAAIAKATGSSS